MAVTYNRITQTKVKPESILEPSIIIIGTLDSHPIQIISCKVHNYIQTT